LQFSRHTVGMIASRRENDEDKKHAWSKQ